METQSSSKPQNPVVRQLATLKVLSRLLGHELHAQGGSKTITLSRDEVTEIQATVDLFIEEIARRPGGQPAAAPIASVAAAEPHLVASRN